MTVLSHSQIMDHFNVLLTRVLKHRGARRREYSRQLERLHFVALTKDENEKTELTRELVDSNKELLECEEKLEKNQTALDREKRITKILQDDLAQFRKFRQQDKDKTEKAEKELRELKANLLSLSQSS